MAEHELGCEIPLMALRKSFGSQPRVVWTDIMFCGSCPDNDRLPTLCSDCDLKFAEYCSRGVLAKCPCTQPATSERWAAFRIWVKRKGI